MNTGGRTEPHHRGGKRRVSGGRGKRGSPYDYHDEVPPLDPDSSSIMQPMDEIPGNEKYKYAPINAITNPGSPPMPMMYPYPMRPPEKPFPWMDKQHSMYIIILLFILTALVAVLVIVILILAYAVSANHGTVYALVSRMAVVENLARNVNDASQVMRRALGERDLNQQDPNDDDDPNKKKKKSGWTNWLEDRGPDEEAMITDNAVRTLVQGFRSLVRLLRQSEESEVMVMATRLGTHVDEIITGPQTANILRTADEIIRHPQAKKIAIQTMDIVDHVETAVLPIIDVVAEEVRRRLIELMESGDSGMTREEFRKLIQEWIDVTHKMGTGMRDFVVWYRSGGPQEAVTLVRHATHTALELSESPAAKSLVTVLKHIDWKETGDHLAASSHNLAAILQAVNDAGTVDSSDRLIRAVAGFLENPNTIKVMEVLPGIAANATALLAQNNTQTFITHTSALMARTDAVLEEAEASRTVERAADFLSSMRLLLNALVIGGMHLEVGQPDYAYSDSSTSSSSSSSYPPHPVETLTNGKVNDALERGDSSTLDKVASEQQHKDISNSLTYLLSKGYSISHYEPERERQLRLLQKQQNDK